MQAHRWLLLVHQLPSSPSNLRVRTWRRLQQLGAIPVKQAVYVLPDSPEAREDFEWLSTEIAAAGGEATVFAADTIDAWSDDGLVEEFRRQRQEAYAELTSDIEKTLTRLDRPRKRAGARQPALGRLLENWRERLEAIERIDFFGSAGRDRAASLLERVAARVTPTRRPTAAPRADAHARAAYRRRLWVTRPRPGVDRMASAWLIRRFIDPHARFGFVADRERAPRGAVPFDMFGVELTHRAESCTFETLVEVFGVKDSAVSRIAQIVHDLDLKDQRFGAPEAVTVGSIIEGLQASHADDLPLLEEGMKLFEALYRAFARVNRREKHAQGSRSSASPSHRSTS